MPKVSVIIPTRTRPHLLARAVQSAFSAGHDVEVVVVDDASTDATAEVCARLPDIRYVRLERNQQTAGARNVGIVASSADYISFHDDDDLRFPGSLDRQIELLAASPQAGLAYGPVVIGDQDCNPSAEIMPRPPCATGDLFWTLLQYPSVPALSLVFRKACLLRVGLLDPHIPGLDDWDLCVRIAEIYHFVAVQEPVGIWRMPTPSSEQGSSGKAAHALRMARHQKRLLHLPRAAAVSREQRRVVRRRFLDRITYSLVRSAAMWLQYGGYHEYALVNLLTALRLNPLRAARLETLWLLLASALRQPRLVGSRLPYLGQSILEKGKQA